ncbi:MAG: branched-chain amino acid aminotransferase [Proteobacteria bacterium]|nr:branched-chain amino acid aminotransferase [Pseudomonadota bacterium]
MEKVNIDWHNLTFKLTPAKTMYVSKTSHDQPWPKGEFVPYGPITISPAAGVLNYGQGIFEGLKAFRNVNDEVVLFRPQENAIRFARSAERICMPPVPEEFFVDVMKQIVRENIEYIPPLSAGSLYLRPCLWGTGEVLGIGMAPEYTFIVYVSPVGNYFKGGAITPVKFMVCEDFHRSAAKGVGNVKFIGNYAPSLKSIYHAKKLGFAGSLYLDAVHEKYVEEAGVANFFCVKNKKIYTPQLSDSILAGVTRASVIQLAREELGLEVIETQLPLETVLESEECFCSGTATVVTPIQAIFHKDKEFNYGPYGDNSITCQIHEMLTKIQHGVIEDKYSWLVKI